MYRKNADFGNLFSKGMEIFGHTCTHYFLSFMLSPRPTVCTCIAVVFLWPLLRKHKQLKLICQALGMLRAGQSSRQVAAVFGNAQNTMSRLLQRLNATQSVNDRRRSGRPKTTRQQDNYICNITLRNRRITVRALQHQLRTAMGVNISDQTVRTTLTQRHRRARRDWCHQHIQWTRQQWSRVLFSDESLFNLYFNDGRKRVYRRQGERFSDATVSEYDRFGGGSVMVWAGVTMNQRTRLYIVDGNLNRRHSSACRCSLSR